MILLRWQVWADPRERERRKASRAAAALDPAVRAGQIAEEYAAAKMEAGKAKAAGDKARQQAAGKIIRELKEEMAKLGKCPFQVAVEKKDNPYHLSLLDSQMTRLLSSGQTDVRNLLEVANGRSIGSD